ncbi:8899_t:CDS:2, partial [Entrophospora sp. SA101]
GGPASRLADFVKEVKEKKLKPYSSYRTLKNLHEVLKKHGIDSKNIADIPQFKPVVDNNESEEFNFNRACKKVSQPVTTKKKSSG